MSCNEHDVLGPGPEAAESSLAWKKCFKNPGHKNFIPVGDFGLHHLPEEWQREDFVATVKNHAALTVRLKVSRTSPARPSDGSYYGANGQGVRVGTGFIDCVSPTTGSCPCRDCKTNETNKKSWIFKIHSAKHVIYDDLEAEHTRADLFYDDDESISDGRMKSVFGVKVLHTSDDNDWCYFACICHDTELARQITEQLDQGKKLWRGLREWFSSLQSQPVINVSHPHGKPKHITIGEMKECSGWGSSWKYTVDTCPGCSGANLIWWWNSLMWEDGPYFMILTHCRKGRSSGCNEGFYNSNLSRHNTEEEQSSNEDLCK